MDRGPRQKTVSIIGAGVVGCALGKALAARGYRIEGVVTRRRTSARRAVKIIRSGTPDTDLAAAKGSQIIFITTPDDAIQAVCARIAAEHGFRPRATVIHCSGALPADALASARASGAYIAALHPLQTFASVEDALALLPGTAFAFEGDLKAKPVCAAVVRALRGAMFALPAENKALYHAAACVASNYLVALFSLAAELMQHAGLKRNEAARALLPLVEGTLRNLRAVGTPAALTGPIARGDDGTVARHLAAMKSLPPEFREIYRVMGLQTLRVARAKGAIDAAAARRLRAILQTAD